MERGDRKHVYKLAWSVMWTANAVLRSPLGARYGDIAKQARRAREQAGRALALLFAEDPRCLRYEADFMDFLEDWA